MSTRLYKSGDELRGMPSDALVKLAVREMEKAIAALAILEKPTVRTYESSADLKQFRKVNPDLSERA